MSALQVEIHGIKGFDIESSPREAVKYPWCRKDRNIGVGSAGACLVLRSLLPTEFALELGLVVNNPQPYTRSFFIMPNQIPEDEYDSENPFLSHRFFDPNDTHSAVVIDFFGNGFVTTERERIYEQAYAGGRFVTRSEIFETPCDLTLQGSFDPSRGRGFAAVSAAK